MSGVLTDPRLVTMRRSDPFLVARFEPPQEIAPGLSADPKLSELDGRISPDKSACRK